MGGKPSMPKVEDKIYAGCRDGLPRLDGKVVAITGTTLGTGYWAAVAAARAGVQLVLMLNRKSERSDAAQAGVQASIPQGAAAGATTSSVAATAVVTVDCDLSSFASTRQAAETVKEIASAHGGLDVLLNNAGVMAVPDKRTVDGYDVQMQTNHLSHFLLTKILMPLLEQAAAARGEARVVQHSSGARAQARAAPGEDGNLLEKYFSKCEEGTLGGDGLKFCFARYHQTKLANPVFMMALHKKLAARGSRVKSLCAEPGVAATELMPNLMAQHEAAGSGGAGICLLRTMFCCMSAAGKVTPQSAADGACPLILAGFGPGVDSGDFYMPESMAGSMVVGSPVKCMEAGKATPKADFQEQKFEHEKLTLSPENQALLWAKSEEAIGEKWAL